jgi:late competence protein required for DNA uptake (superfamily II DNA/RNA helicase)
MTSAAPEVLPSSSSAIIWSAVSPKTLKRSIKLEKNDYRIIKRYFHKPKSHKKP